MTQPAVGYLVSLLSLALLPLFLCPFPGRSNKVSVSAGNLEEEPKTISAACKQRAKYFRFQSIDIMQSCSTGVSKCVWAAGEKNRCNMCALKVKQSEDNTVA